MIDYNPRIDALREKANELVEKPGVYLMKDVNNEIIYIGKAKRLKHRVVSYFRQNKGHNNKVRKMVSLVDHFDYIVTDSEYEALILECSLIKQYLPKYNILLKDDKGYPYIEVTNEAYPRIKAVKQKLDNGSTYLGPFTSGISVKQSVDDVNRLFGLPTCSKHFPEDFHKERPCLNYHIHRCNGICRGRVSRAEYQNIIQDAISYLKNGEKQTTALLQQQMEAAAERLDFEKAAKLRDRIRAIEKLGETQKVLRSDETSHDYIGMEQLGDHIAIAVLQFRRGQLHNKEDFLFRDAEDKEETLADFLPQFYHKGSDVPKIVSLDIELEDTELYENYLSMVGGRKVHITIPQRGEQKKLIDMAKSNALEQLSMKRHQKSPEITAMQELGKLLGLLKAPEYIESYDISNIGNDYMVAGMIVFENARPLRKAYKRFSIKEQLTQDDYACMQEVLRRRFTHYLDPNETDEGFKRKPDLILLDGGKGHVAAVQQVLDELGIVVPLYGLVKDSKHKTRAIATDGGEIQISTFRSAFRVCTQIQDEVHRFAIAYQRQKQNKKNFALSLQEVPGIGEKKAAALLRQFKTKTALKAASVEDLQAAAKVNVTIAQALYDFLQNL